MAILTDKTALTTPDLQDVIHIVDVSDTTSNPAGTSKKVTLSFIQSLFQATKVKIINKLADLPAPATGVITLADGVAYVLGNDVDLGTNRIQLGTNNAFSGFNSNSPTLTYTGTGAMFTGRQVSFQSFNLNMSCAMGTVYDFEDDVTPGQSSVLFANVDMGPCVKVGTFNNLALVDIRTLVSVDADDGLNFIGSTWQAIIIDNLELATTSPSFVGIDLGTAVATSITLMDYLMSGPSGSTAVVGAGSNANLPAGSTGSITGGDVIGDTTPISGITSSDIRWFLNANGQIADTNPVGLAAMTNNGTFTVISAANTPVKVAGTFTAEVASHFSVDATGTITYLGERDLCASMDTSATVITASGNRQATTLIAINGTAITNSGKSMAVNSSDPNNASTFWEAVLTTGDTVEVFISNNSGTQNLLASDVTLRVK